MYQTISEHESLQPVTYQIDTDRLEKSQIKDSAKEQYNQLPTSTYHETTKTVYARQSRTLIPKKPSLADKILRNEDCQL